MWRRSRAWHPPGADALFKHERDRLSAPRTHGCRWCGRAMQFTDMFRPRAGTAPHACLRVKPALSWKTRIVAVKDVPAGAHIGYGGSYVAAVPMRHGGAGGGLCRWRPAPPVEQGESDRGRPLRADTGHGIDGSDDDRYLAFRRKCKPGDEVTLLGRKATFRSMRSRLRAPRARFLITFCAGSCAGQEILYPLSHAAGYLPCSSRLLAPRRTWSLYFPWPVQLKFCSSPISSLRTDRHRGSRP